VELWSCAPSESVSATLGYDCQVVCPQCGHLAPVTETPQLQRFRRSIGSQVLDQRYNHRGFFLFLSCFSFLVILACFSFLLILAFEIGLAIFMRGLCSHSDLFESDFLGIWLIFLFGDFPKIVSYFNLMFLLLLGFPISIFAFYYFVRFAYFNLCFL